MTLIGTVYGAARENAMLSAQENDGTIIAASFIDTLPTEAAKALSSASRGSPENPTTSASMASTAIGA